MTRAKPLVAVVGAGGLGCPLALALSEAGCRLILIDDDQVELSNLQRQVLFATPDLGRSKLEAAAEALVTRGSAEPSDLILRSGRLTAESVEALLDGADLAIDASDDPEVRFLVNAWGLRHRRPIVIGGVHRFQGMVFAHAGQGPCFACVFDEDGPEVETCSAAGVIGALAGVIGHLQAEAALVLLGLENGPSPVGSLQSLDALRGERRSLRVRPHPDCPACGTR